VLDDNNNSKLAMNHNSNNNNKIILTIPISQVYNITKTEQKTSPQDPQGETYVYITVATSRYCFINDWSEDWKQNL
jgi:hypothetical protein